MSAPAELLRVAERVVWFKSPDEALEDRNFFLAQLMTYGTIEDIVSAKRFFTEADFRKALEFAPPGIFDKRSWAYWNIVLGRRPVPAMPKRSIPTSREEALGRE